MNDLSSIARFRQQMGLSLIELMVAMAIGLVLMLGLVQVMGASRESYRLSEGIARTQENARFAVDFLQRDVRMAGHLGCVNDQARMQGAEGVFSHTTQDLRFDMGVQGFEAPGSAPGGSIALAGGAPSAAPVNNWQPQLPASVFALGPVAGSDVLMVRYLSPVGTGIARANGFTLNGGGGVSIRPAAFPNAALDGMADGASGLFGISDCMNVSIFPGTVDLADGTVTFAPGGGAGPFTAAETYSPGQAVLHRAHSVVFYVAPGSNPDNPSLWRAEADIAGNWSREELVEGIESMQLMFGRDFAGPANRPTGSITRSNIASAIGGGVTNPNAAQSDDWRRVGDVQIGLLMRSTSVASAEQADQSPSVLGTRMELDGNDRFYRSVYETTVALRNRLFGN